MRRRLAPRWVAELRRRSPALAPGASRYTGEVNDGNAVMVEALIDSTWVNLSGQGDVLYENGIDLRRGTSSEGNESDAGQLTFVLLNNATNEYRYSGNNAESPYFEKFERSTRVRVSVPEGFGKSYRFQGEITELEEEWDITGTHGTVTVQAAGLLERVGRGERLARSALYRDVMRIDPAGLRDLPVAYWPMEDAADAQSLANEIEPLRPMEFNGDPELAALQAFPCSDSVPNITGTKFSARIPPYYNRAANQFSATTCWFLMYAPTTITNNMVIARFSSRNHRFDITQPAANQIRLLIYSNTDTALFDSTVALTIANTPMWIGLWMQDLRDSNQMDFALYSQGTAEVATLNGLINGSLVSEHAEPIGSININPSGTASDVYVGHVAIFNHPHDGDGSALAFFPRPFVLSAYVGERADTRFGRLCTEEGITYETLPALTPHPLGQGIMAGIGQKMGKQNVQTIMALLRECEAADAGIIYEMTSDLGLGFRTLNNMTSNSASTSFDHSLNELALQPAPRRDLGRIVNDFTATREAGSSAHIEDTESRLSIHDAPLGVGRFDDSGEFNLYADAQLPSTASWQVHLGTVAEARYERIAIQLAHDTFKETPSKRSAALAVILGDRVDIVNTPDRLSFDDISQLVIGVSERIDQFTHQIIWNSVPEKPFRIPILTDDQARLDSDSALTTEDLSAVATSITVSTTTSRWVDSATYPAEFPFDINIGGEQITVTAITGTSSPQTFTMTRSVNGVTKAHNVGAKVRLWNPTYLALPDPISETGPVG